MLAKRIKYLVKTSDENSELKVRHELQREGKRERERVDSNFPHVSQVQLY